METITTLIILFLSFMPMVAHLYLDYHVKPILHWRSATVVTALATVIGLLNRHFTGVDFKLFAILALCTHFALFDVIWNEVNHKKLEYLGTVNNPNRALTDRIWSKLPEWLQAVIRIVVLSGGWIMFLKFK